MNNTGFPESILKDMVKETYSRSIIRAGIISAFLLNSVHAVSRKKYLRYGDSKEMLSGIVLTSLYNESINMFKAENEELSSQFDGSPFRVFKSDYEYIDITSPRVHVLIEYMDSTNRARIDIVFAGRDRDNKPVVVGSGYSEFIPVTVKPDKFLVKVEKAFVAVETALRERTLENMEKHT